MEEYGCLRWLVILGGDYACHGRMQECMAGGMHNISGLAYAIIK